MTALIEALQADITTLRVDAVVNAANRQLRRGGGVDGAIHAAAGPDLQQACRDLGECQPGEAKATPGFRLPARWVIHTVGPVWRGDQAGERRILASCYRRSIEVAEELQARSVAFPAISTGVYGFPVDLAAEVALSTLRSCPTSSVSRVVLVAFDGDTRSLYEELLGDAGTG